MKILGVIPARYGSTRFPGKPLVKIQGKAMVLHVYDQALSSGLFDELCIATDDDRIYQEAINYGANVKMTQLHHLSGTDRCSEIAALFTEIDYVINIQGDEPMIAKQQLEELINGFSNAGVKIVTLKKEIKDLEEVNNTNVVKVVTDLKGNAIYFSRSPIPFQRNNNDLLKYYKHIGLYGFDRKTLLKLTALPSSKLEESEALEQLRWLDNGFEIRVVETSIESISIDTPEDLKKL